MAIPFPELQARVRAHLAKGETKEAVELARGAHGRAPNAETEALAIEAYLARVANLKVRGLAVEAKLLAENVRTRFPKTSAALDEILGIETLDSIVRPLADASVSDEVRVRVEARVRDEVWDLSALADTPALPEGHALRVAARALDAAFLAVTSGPIADSALLLPEVSRRSPLAPWKALLRAIAAYHRRDDDACRQALEAILPGSAAARAIPALRSLLEGRGHGGLKAEARVSELRDALLKVDEARATRRPRRVLQAAVAAMTACARFAPELTGRLHGRLAVACAILDLPTERIRDALGSVESRAAYWQLLARANELRGAEGAAALAWQEFARTAVLEGRLRDGSSEQGLVLLRAAECLRRGDVGGGAPNREALALFARASALDPHPETFERRYADAREHGRDARLLDRIAEEWAAALPKDPRPLLLLMDSAEERDALTKALGYLERAEQLDAVNPEVRRARYRLLVATAFRHARQRKMHLLEKDLAKLEELPEAQDGRRSALLRGLRWVMACARFGDESGRERHLAEVTQILEGGHGAAVLLEALARRCGGDVPLTPQTGSAVASVARAQMLASEVALALRPGAAALRAVEAELAKDAPGASPAELLALGALLADGSRALAFAIAGIGLRRGGPTVARFLLLRARSLPTFSTRRRIEACAAAIELARRQRDNDLVKEAVEVARSHDRWGRGDFAPGETVLAPAALEKAIAFERDAKEYPTTPPPQERLCSCGRPLGHGPASDLDDDDLDDDDLDDDDVGLPDPLAAMEDLANAPEPVKRAFQALVEKHRRPDGTLPPIDQVRRRDPEGVARLMLALVETGYLLDEPGRKRRGR